MTANQLIAQSKKGTLNGVYLLDGEEEYLKQQTFNQVKSLLVPEDFESLNLTILTNPTAEDLIDACEVLPFMSEQRVVIVNECEALLPSKKNNDEFLELFLPYLDNINPSTCLFFYVKGNADGRKKLATTIKKNYNTIRFGLMDFTTAEIWATDLLKERGISLSSNTAQKLVFTVGTQAATLNEEIDKLASYVFPNTKISPEDIEAICTKNIQSTVFEMLDELANGKPNKAYELLFHLLKQGENEIQILSLLSRQYRILHQVRCLLDENMSNTQITSLLQMAPYQSRKLFAQVANRSAKQIYRVYSYLHQSEFEIKQGKQLVEGCVFTAMLSISYILNPTRSK